MSNDIHEVYAVRYATHARKRSENYIFGDPHDEMTSIAYYVWVIKGPHGTFVCDTGFDDLAAKERARKIIHPVGEGLQALGVAPDKIDHVITYARRTEHGILIAIVIAAIIVAIKLLRRRKRIARAAAVPE